MTLSPPPLRVTVPLLMLVLGCLLGGLWTFKAIQTGYQRVEQSQLEASRFTAASVVPQVEAFYRRGEAERARTFLNRLNADRQLSRVLLVDHRGEILYSARFAEEGRMLDSGRFADLAASALETKQDLVRLENGREKVRSAFPVWLGAPHEQSVEPRGVLLMERDLRFLKDQARHRAWESLLITLGILFLLCTLTWAILHRIVTRRLRRLIHVTTQLAEGRSETRAELWGPDELAQIGRAFDEMALKIDTTQKELRDREQLFGRLIEHGTDIISLIDAEGTVLFVSPSVKRILGFDPRSLLGESLFGLIHPDDRVRAQSALSKALTHPDPLTVEVRARHSDSHWVLLEAIGNSPPEMEGRGEVVVNARDITQWKELQDRLRQSEKMQAVGQLAGGIAHDFNNLLTAITGYSSLLNRELEPDSTAADHLAEISKAAERGSNLVRQLLAFSRKQVLKPSNIDLNTVIRELEGLLRRTLGEQIDLVMDLSEKPPVVRADRTQLEQVLVNLAVNAQHAMPEGGLLEISTRVTGQLPAAAQDLKENGSYVLMSVRDTGTGIPDDIRERIFDPFFTSKAGGKGTGLGLATVHGIVTQSRGAIWVNSAVGEGATFTICFPRSDSEAASAESVEVAAPAVSPADFSGRALVVEDEAAVRTLVSRTLGQSGFEVESFERVQSARQFLRDTADESLALVVSDVVLPDGSGRELAEYVKDNFSNTAVLLMSGYAEEMVGEIDSPPAFGFMAKPFSPEELLEAVRKAKAEIGDGRP